MFAKLWIISNLYTPQKQAGRLKVAEVEEVKEGASAGSKGRMRHKCRDFKQSIQINQMPATVTATT